MITFLEYLEMRRGPAPGAFGREGGSAFGTLRTDRKVQMPTKVDPLSNRFQDLYTRVQSGKVKEGIIINTLKDKGFNITSATVSQDMHDKIDGWLDGNKPVQIKYRDTGDDILMEIIKPFAPNMVNNYTFSGRDMRGKAEIYISLNLARDIIRIRDAKAIKQLAQNLTHEFIDYYQKTNLRSLTTKEGTVKFTEDPANHVGKIMAYISPNAVPGQDIKLSEPLW